MVTFFIDLIILAIPFFSLKRDNKRLQLGKNNLMID
jgi:hypothetical protein